MTVGTEIGVASILQIIMTAGGIVYAWADSRSRIKVVEKRIDEYEMTIYALKEAFALYRETQARQLVSREILRDFEAHIGGKMTEQTQQITYLRERLDDLYDRMIAGK